MQPVALSLKLCLGEHKIYSNCSRSPFPALRTVKNPLDRKKQPVSIEICRSKPRACICTPLFLVLLLLLTVINIIAVIVITPSLCSYQPLRPDGVFGREMKAGSLNMGKAMVSSSVQDGLI